jgi:hypothetical protein
MMFLSELNHNYPLNYRHLNMMHFMIYTMGRMDYIGIILSFYTAHWNFSSSSSLNASCADQWAGITGVCVSMLCHITRA